MKLNDFNFYLPEGLIATRPVVPRSSSRLLVAQAGEVIDGHCLDLPDWLRPGDRLVLNDTKVIPARLRGRRYRQGPEGATRAAIEVTLLSPTTNGDWSALIKPLKKIRDGEDIWFSDDFCARFISRHDGQARLSFNLKAEAFDAALAQYGLMPLPPYIASKRPADAQDNIDYQTVFAQTSGAVAAPTASLHFDHGLLAQLRDRGVSFSYVTLHVGAGTFLPIQVDDVATHKMHAEWGRVSATAAAEIAATKAAGGRIIPVGTTALRLIETAARSGEITSWEGPTDIFIYPGFAFQVCDGLMTNFHLPKSTLMMLVSALMGQAQIKTIYAHAIDQDYRFFSYGDASLLFPAEKLIV